MHMCVCFASQGATRYRDPSERDRLGIAAVKRAVSGTIIYADRFNGDIMEARTLLETMQVLSCHARMCSIRPTYIVCACYSLASCCYRVTFFYC